MKTDPYVIAFVTAVAAFGLASGAGYLGLNPLFTAEANATEVLKKNGFTPVKVGGYGWFDCGVGEDSDLWRTRFTAKNPKGEIVNGTVCEGLVKGGTFRF